VGGNAAVQPAAGYAPGAGADVAEAGGEQIDPHKTHNNNKYQHHQQQQKQQKQQKQKQKQQKQQKQH